VQLLAGADFYFFLPTSFLSVLFNSYTKEHLWDKSCRFMHKSNEIFRSICIHVMAEALNITDRSFQTECVDTVGKWILQKQDTIINNTKSPYREKLKKCE
jgi:hypothetical protein